MQEKNNHRFLEDLVGVPAFMVEKEKHNKSWD